MEYLTNFFERAKKNKQIKPDVSPEYATVGFMALFNGLIELKLMHKDNVCLRECGGPALDLFFSGMAHHSDPEMTRSPRPMISGQGAPIPMRE